MFERALHVLKNLVILFALGTAYAVLCRLTGLGVPCPVRFFTKLYCPSCGVSRMCLSILRLDFHDAFMCNPCLFILSPFIIVSVTAQIIKYIVTGSRKTGIILNICYLLIIISLIIFGILRNIPKFYFLRPPA